MEYLIGDTIRLKATIKNLAGEEEAPADISVKICKSDGTKIYEDATPNLTPGTTAQYYSDWEIDTIESITSLIMIWDWSGPHKKKLSFTVVPEF